MPSTLHPKLSFTDLSILLLFLTSRCMVLMLYLASSLLIFPETICTYGIMTMPITLLSRVLCFFFRWKVCRISIVLQPFFWNFFSRGTFLKLYISPSKLLGPQTVLDQPISVDKIALFCARWCSDLVWRYQSVWVGFLYTSWTIVPSSCLFTNTSKNGNELLF